MMKLCDNYSEKNVKNRNGTLVKYFLSHAFSLDCTAGSTWLFSGLFCTLFASVHLESLWGHWLKGGTHNSPESHFSTIFSSFLSPLSQVIVSDQPCTQHIGVSNKTDDTNTGARLFPRCTHSLADTKAVNHDGQGNVYVSASTSWKWYKSSVPLYRHRLPLPPPSNFLILLLEWTVIHFFQKGTYFFMYLLYKTPRKNCFADILPFNLQLKG